MQTHTHEFLWRRVTPDIEQWRRLLHSIARISSTLLCRLNAKKPQQHQAQPFLPFVSLSGFFNPTYKNQCECMYVWFVRIITSSQTAELLLIAAHSKMKTVAYDSNRKQDRCRKLQRGWCSLCVPFSSNFLVFFSRAVVVLQDQMREYTGGSEKGKTKSKRIQFNDFI